MNNKAIIKIFLTLATFAIIFVAWNEPDLSKKVVVLLFILTWIFFYEKILAFDSDTGPWEYTWEGFETPENVRLKLVSEYPMGSYDLTLVPIQYNRPPVFVFLAKKNGKQFIFLCNALLEQKWVMLCPPIEFKELTYLNGAKKLKEIILEQWPGRKQAIENEIKGLAADALEKADTDNQPIIVQGGG